ncbi:hypothetical protein [Cellulomonas shaoxiangyii]|uniref:DUF559 domain-containing protein n=1 Tax=Cellulomonas shaoxiangyii TaxID=2566013 RepID=A0A4P7SHL6_9CELL|nr:hypothetical protein [Cellulomonas shaoxiangyii]QCB92606.1 hypothetical protein E5225_02600 [Cellulomonas shaoxiangyii]TGY85238.1 hypothetical protein E5226_07455 [Cellulomonas shaoxiangyii]
MARALPVPADLCALAASQEGLLSTRQCEAAGVGPARRSRLVRARRWARVITGVYDVVPARPRAPDASRRRAAWIGVLAYGPDAVAVGASALALHGVNGLPALVVPEVALPARRYAPGRGDVRVRRFATSAVVLGHARVAPLPLALVQALPEMSRDHAVAVLDDVLHHRRLTGPELESVRARTTGRRGAARLHGCWALVDPRAESPLETFARLRCVDGGVPPDAVQLVVRAPDGGFVGRCDLAWRRADGRWLLGEVDGREFHDVPHALHHDRRRQNALVALGHTVLRFTAADVATGAIATTIRTTLAAPNP